jgi:hypothetical protein
VITLAASKPLKALADVRKLVNWDNRNCHNRQSLSVDYGGKAPSETVVTVGYRARFILKK